MRNGGSGRPTVGGEKFVDKKLKSYWQTSGIIFIVDVYCYEFISCLLESMMLLKVW